MEKETVIKVARGVVETINSLEPAERRDLVLKLEKELRKLIFGEDDRVAGLVFSTKDLSQFKDMKGNRLINENSASLRKLADAISRSEGNLSPVVINEHWEKADGQRRILAMRKYGLPYELTYVIKKGVTIREVSDMNKNQDKWNHKDYLHEHVEFGTPSYVKYEEIASRHETYMKSRSLRGLLMNNRVDSLSTDVWESGEFKIDEEHLDTNINFLKYLEQVYLIGGKDNIFAKDRNFQKALHDIYTKTKKFNEERMLVKLRTFIGRVNIRTDYKTYKKILGELYNSRLRGDSPHAVSVEPEEKEVQLTFKD